MKTLLLIITLTFIVSCAPDPTMAEDVRFEVEYTGSWDGAITMDDEEIAISGTGAAEYTYAHYRSWYYISVQKDDDSNNKISVKIEGITGSGEVVITESGSSTSAYGIASTSLMSEIY